MGTVGGSGQSSEWTSEGETTTCDPFSALLYLCQGTLAGAVKSFGRASSHGKEVKGGEMTYLLLAPQLRKQHLRTRRKILTLLLLLPAAFLRTLPHLSLLNLQRTLPCATSTNRVGVGVCEMIPQDLPRRFNRREPDERSRDGIGRVHEGETGVFEEQDAFLCCAGVAVATVQKVVVSLMVCLGRVEQEKGECGGKGVKGKGGDLVYLQSVRCAASQHIPFLSDTWVFSVRRNLVTALGGMVEGLLGRDLGGAED